MEDARIKSPPQAPKLLISPLKSSNSLSLILSFEINFDKNQIIEEGFVQAFNQLILSIIKSKDKNSKFKKKL